MPGRSFVAFVLLIISQSNVVSEISPGACIPKRAREITRGTPEPSPALNQQYKSPHSTRSIESRSQQCNSTKSSIRKVETPDACLLSICPITTCRELSAKTLLNRVIVSPKNEGC